jgi:hypothetical protein
MNKRVSLIQKSILGFQDVVILLSNCLPAEDRVWWKPYDVHFIRLASTASFDPTAWTSSESQNSKMMEGRGSVQANYFAYGCLAS